MLVPRRVFSSPHTNNRHHHLVDRRQSGHRSESLSGTVSGPMARRPIKTTLSYHTRRVFCVCGANISLESDTGCTIWSSWPEAKCFAVVARPIIVIRLPKIYRLEASQSICPRQLRSRGCVNSTRVRLDPRLELTRCNVQPMD